MNAFWRPKGGCTGSMADKGTGVCLLVEIFCTPEIGNLESAITAQQNVFGFKVSMTYTPRVKIIEGAKELQHKYLYSIRGIL